MADICVGEMADFFLICTFIIDTLGYIQEA